MQDLVFLRRPNHGKSDSIFREAQNERKEPRGTTRLGIAASR